MPDATTTLGIATLLALVAPFLAAQEPRRLDPASWGSDHVGQAVPEFTSGDECLFCHRMDVGPTWGTNRHGQTIRAASADAESLTGLKASPPFKAFANEVEFIMGGKNRQRFLKPSDLRGRLDILSLAWIPKRGDMAGRLVGDAAVRWDNRKFATDCAGCHATGVDSSQQAFSAISLDCFTCHGEVPENHTTQGALVFLSPHRRDSPHVITSICAQCHLRTATSKTSRLPYPNNFVAGDNLFRDFQVDLSDAAIQKLNPADRHVQENVRDVVLLGRTDLTCLSCHDVHKQSSQKHYRVARGNICSNCHGTGSKKDRVPYEVHSTTCGY